MLKQFTSAVVVIAALTALGALTACDDKAAEKQAEDNARAAVDALPPGTRPLPTPDRPVPAPPPAEPVAATPLPPAPPVEKAPEKGGGW